MSIRILQGDCREVLRTLEADSVQCVVTSPPYYGLRDYGVDGQIGLERTPDEYVAELVAVFREVRRVLREDGVVFLNLGDSYANDEKWGGYIGGKHVGGKDGSEGYRLKRNTGLKPKDLMMIPARVALALQSDGWWLRSEIVWAKPNPMPESCTDRPTSAHEKVFLLTKAARYYYDADAVREGCESGPSDLRKMAESQPRIGGKHKELVDQFSKASAATNIGRKRSVGGVDGQRNLRNVWTIATAPFSGAHFATMPPSLAERCIKAGTSEGGCCEACGAPFARVLGGAQPAPGRSSGNKARKVATDGERSRTNTHLGSSIPWEPTATPTIGWHPTCNCPVAAPVPCVVLDPFGGAGTTALVADRLQRDAVHIDLNTEYADLAVKRITQDAPLFATVERS